MHSSSPPKAPKTKDLMNAANESAEEAATHNFERSLVNQETPFGSLGWEKGEDGRWTAVQKFTPEQQHLLDQYQAYGSNINDAGTSWADFIKGMDPGTNGLDAASLDQSIIDAYRPQYQENYDLERRKYETTLANKGMKLGSDGYAAAMRDFDLNQGDVWARQARDANAQSFSQALQRRNQPFSELSNIHSMMVGPTNPNYVQTPQYNQNTVDAAGIMQQGYNNQYQQYADKQAQDNAFMSGLFSLGGTVLGSVAGPMGASLGSQLGSSIGGWAMGGQGAGNSLPWQRPGYSGSGY